MVAALRSGVVGAALDLPGSLGVVLVLGLDGGAVGRAIARAGVVVDGGDGAGLGITAQRR